MDPSCKSSSPTRSTAGPQRVGAALPEGRLLDAVFSLQFLARTEYVLLVDPAGVGKSFIAQAIGYAAIGADHSVRFLRAADSFRVMAQARVDHSTDRTFRSFLSPDLLILDDLGLHRMTQQQSIDLYELVIARHRRSSFVSPPTGPSTSGWASSKTPSSATAPSTVSPTPATRSSSRAGASGRGCRPIGHCSIERRWLAPKPHSDKSPHTRNPRVAPISRWYLGRDHGWSIAPDYRQLGR